MKKIFMIFSVLLMAVMLGIISIIPVKADEPPVNYFLENENTGAMYGSIQEAFDEAQNGETIRMIKSHTLIFDEKSDFSSSSTGLVGIGVLNGTKNDDNSYVERNVTFDLSGYTLTLNITYTQASNTFGFSVENSGRLTFMDSSEAQSGEIDMHAPSENNKIPYMMLNYTETGALIIKSGKYSLDYVSSALIYSQHPSDHTKGIWVQGGTFYVGSKNNDGLLWIFNAKGSGHGAGNSNYITGGTFNCDVNHQSNRFEVDLYPQYALKSDANGEWWTVVPAFCYVGEYSGGYYDAIGYASLKEALEWTNSETVPTTKFGSAVNIYGDFDANAEGNNFDGIESRNYTVNINFSDHQHADSLIKDSCNITGDLVIPENVTVNIYKTVNILGTLTNYGTINFMDEDSTLNVYGQMVNHGTVHFADGSTGSCINAYGKVVNAKDFTADSNLAQDAVIIRNISVFGEENGQFGVISEGEFTSEPNSTMDLKINISKYQTVYESSSAVFVKMISNPAAMLKRYDGTYTLYANLAEACANAEEGDTVILLKDGSGAELISKDGVDITINLNKWNLTAAENCYVFDYSGGIDAEGWSGVAYVVSDKTLDELETIVAERQIKSTIGKYFVGWNNEGNLFNAVWKANGIEKIEYELKDGEHTYTIIMTDGTKTTFTVSSLEEKLKELENNLNAANEKIANNENDIKTLIENVKILTESKNEAESAITALQTLTGEQGVEISTLKQAVTGLQEAVNAANVKIAAAEARIEALESKVEALETAKTNLETAVSALQKAIEDVDTELNTKITALNTALLEAKAVLASLETADKELQVLLEGKLAEAEEALNKSISDLTAKLDKAIEDLGKAINNGDQSLDEKIKALNESLTAAKTLLETVDKDKDELISKIEAADATLDAAIKAVQKNLDDLKAQLEKANAELESKDNKLQTLIVIESIISGVALCGSSAFVIWFFIDRKKKFSK